MLYNAGSDLFGCELGLIEAPPVQPNEVFLIPRHIGVVFRGPRVYAALFKGALIVAYGAVQAHRLSINSDRLL